MGSPARPQGFQTGFGSDARVGSGTNPTLGRVTNSISKGKTKRSKTGTGTKIDLDEVSSSTASITLGTIDIPKGWYSLSGVVRAELSSGSWVDEKLRLFFNDIHTGDEVDIRFTDGALTVLHCPGIHVPGTAGSLDVIVTTSGDASAGWSAYGDFYLSPLPGGLHG